MSFIKEIQNFHSISLFKETNLKSEELAIDIKNAFFEYKKNKTVLDFLTIQVPKVKIFALLGPNGTGKTTLIKTMLGRLQLKSGSIKVFGIKPGSKYSDIPGSGVGYMPQELALFEELTIKESLTYYGTLFHLNDKQINQRIEELIELLNLPEKSRLIKRLSGGQQRRVSIAITMIHRPKLIILDEPTVGVDSLLRHKIWEYLEDCCLKYGQTVLITTHYIEEAKSASNVAFMSNGSVLRQSDPQTLLREYNCQTLESVFLKLCQQNESISKTTQTLGQTFEPLINTQTIEKKNKIIKNKFFDTKRIKSILFKYSIESFRKPHFLFIYYLTPIFVFIATKLAIDQEPAHIPVTYFNEDQNPEYSQMIINNIDKYHIDLKMSSSIESAIESVVNGSTYLSIVFGKNYSDNIGYRLKDLIQITDEELKQSEIKIYPDLANLPMGMYAISHVLLAFNKFLDQISSEYGPNTKRFFHLISIETVYGEMGIHLADLFTPGIIMGVSMVLSSLLSSLQITLDFNNSSLDRILVSGVRPLEIMISFFILYLILISSQTLVTHFIIFFVFEYTQNGSYFVVFLLTLGAGLQGMAIGQTTAIITKSLITVMMTHFAATITLVFISGVFWPYEALPGVFKIIAQIGPLGLPLQAFRAALMRGWPLSNEVVYSGLTLSLTYFILLSIFNIFALNKLLK